MDFFTSDLIARLNCSDEEVSTRAQQLWREKLQAYEAHIASIAQSIPKPLLDLDIHGMTLDAMATQLSAQGDVDVALDMAFKGERCRLEYYNVREWRFYDGGEHTRANMSGIGDCVADEIRLIGGDCVHEMVFEHGALIRLRFADFHYVVRTAAAPPAAPVPGDAKTQRASPRGRVQPQRSRS